ncbi:MAG: hypothetical protein RIB98_14525 [Acidimicrobiales bacterium]
MVYPIPEPDDVLPVVLDDLAHLVPSLSAGIDFANDLLSDDTDKDNHYWSHSARYKARRELIASGAPVRPDVANSGIHLVLGDLHTARVLRSVNRETPPPGHSTERRSEYNVQQTLNLAIGVNGQRLPSLPFVIDWYDLDDEPVVHIGLPREPWSWGKKIKMFWRVPLPGAEGGYSGLRFNPSDDGGEPDIVYVHPAEESRKGQSG